MKKILALVLVAVLILTCAVIPASANESDNSLIQPHYEVVCPGGAQHIMVAKGIAQVYTGTLYNPGTLIFSGFAWKCSGCGMMLGTEGSPLRSGVIGRYAINNCSYTDTMALFYGGVTGTFYGNIKTDSFWKHFAFPL